MKKYVGIALLLTILTTIPSMSQDYETRIRHTVVFKLKHPQGSAEERDFISAIMKLAQIPGVENFECMKQVSKKNPYTYGLSMEFTGREAYDRYSNHPDHNAFVQQRWMTEVEMFMEMDYEIPPVKQAGQ
jgi:outer membrane receptor for ferrienterochelin and colicin